MLEKDRNALLLLALLLWLTLVFLGLNNSGKTELAQLFGTFWVLLYAFSFLKFVRIVHFNWDNKYQQRAISMFKSVKLLHLIFVIFFSAPFAIIFLATITIPFKYEPLPFFFITSTAAAIFNPLLDAAYPCSDTSVVV